MERIAILVPTFRRTDRWQQVVDNALHATPEAAVYIIAEPDEADTSVQDATVLTRPEGFGTYSAAINYGYRSTSEPLVFAGADDLNFWDGWATHCRNLLQDRPEVQVVGTNDLGNPEVLAGVHATHYLVRRGYLDTVGGTADHQPGVFLAECYDHNWADKEFTALAAHRGVFAPCLDAVVEHLHPAWGKALMDSTYGKSFANEPADAALFRQRMQEATA